MYGGHAVISIGHTHPHWVKRIEDNWIKLLFIPIVYIFLLQQQLAEKLGKVSGKEDLSVISCEQWRRS